MASNINSIASLLKAQRTSKPIHPNSFRAVSSSTVIPTITFTTNGKQNISVTTSSSSIISEPKLKISSVVSLKAGDISDTLKGDSLQQLSTNALPPYRATALQTPTSTTELHCCTDCGDTFALKSSLIFHLERRSTLIKFICESCTSPQIFYNRCALLSHIRNHSDKGQPSDMHKAIVCPLPRVFMDGIHSEFLNNLEEELNSAEDADETAPANLLEVSIKELDVYEEDKETIPEPKAVEREIMEISATKVKCFDCDQEFDSVTARKEHLTNGDKIPVNNGGDSTTCNKCGILCPSKCSYKAHQRTHLQVSPYICPECGESPNPYWDQFQAHLKYKCFHFSRAVGLKCPVCKRVVRNSEALQKHMELHTERYAKCDTCPRAFKSPAAFNAHKKSEHEGVTVNYNIIYKCALCDIVFVTKDRMLTHKDEHLKDHVCEYIFNCMQCGKALDTKLTLLEHLKACHMKTYRMNVCEDLKLKTKANALNSDYKGRVECILCNCSFLSHQGYGVHIARSHINSKIPCNFCFIVMSNRKEMITHGKKHLAKGNFLCLLCHNKKFDQRSSLNSHLYTHVERLKFCTFCPICDNELRSAKIALEHLRSEHFLLPNPDEKRKSEENNNVQITQPPSIACHFCRALFDNDDSLQEHLVKHHSIQAKTNNAENGISSAEPLPKRQRPSEDVCAKCLFKSSDRTEFKKHILAHKTNKNTFQCQDCGLCFVVQPSLTKHLKIVHKIHDVKKYIEEEGTNFSPDSKSTTDSPSHDALMCSVCSTSFPSDTALKTHMRSHGMAFIQAKKAIVF